MTIHPSPSLVESLYPDILFHFTNKNALYGILSSTFQVSYAREKIFGPNKSKAFGVPMVSFCDLRLSELKMHMNKYGSYGIGLSKEWANRNGLNPVMYLSRHCIFADEFIDGVNGIHSYLNKLQSENDLGNANMYLEKILNTYRYLKNYECELDRDGKKTYVRHADEREWRFVPPLSSDIPHPIAMVSKLNNKNEKQFLNSKVNHIKLSFQPDDIKYLIIDNENEIPELIKHLKFAKDKFDQQTIEKLMSRILTSEQIKQDI